MIQNGLHFAASKQPERFDALEKAGFKTERYGNLTDCLYRRMGGHYMDVGASAKIAKGLVSFIPFCLSRSSANVATYRLRLNQTPSQFGTRQMVSSSLMARISKLM